jgi:hypothetical protein
MGGALNREVATTGTVLIYSARWVHSTVTMSPITITVEPVVASAEALTGRAAVGEPPDLIAPIVGFRNWRIHRTGPAQGALSSPYHPVTWSEPVMRARCRRWRSPEELLHPPHAAPDSACGCGIRAYHEATGDFPTVDHLGVSGIVTIWGKLEIGADEMRAEMARVEALALYSRWTRRQRAAVQAAAADLGADLVDLRELEAAGGAYGAPPPAAWLAQPRPTGLRHRFAALFASRVGD